MESRAWDINDARQIVGEAEIVSGAWHAFLYTAEEGMLDLNSRIDPSVGWVLQIARGINAAGQITGTGTINGQTHAFLLTPAPSSGTGAWARIDAPFQDFGGVLANGTTKTRTVTLTNAGDAPLTINGVTLAGGDPADFSVGNATGQTIAPGGSTTLTVTFTSNTAGPHAAFLSVSSNAYYSPATVKLVAKGIGVTPRLQPDASTLDFGSVPQGTSATKSLTVTNSGDAALTLTGAIFTGANSGDFTVTGNTAATLAPGASAALTVAFTAGAAGSRGASLTLTVTPSMTQ